LKKFAFTERSLWNCRLLKQTKALHVKEKHGEAGAKNKNNIRENDTSSSNYL
jgi:hypothetical protein